MMLIIKLYGLILFLSIIIDWNLPGFTNMQLFVNHFIAYSEAFSKFLINSCNSLEKAEMVLSAKLCKLPVH